MTSQFPPPKLVKFNIPEVSHQVLAVTTKFKFNLNEAELSAQLTAQNFAHNNLKCHTGDVTVQYTEKAD